MDDQMRIDLGGKILAALLRKDRDAALRMMKRCPVVWDLEMLEVAATAMARMAWREIRSRPGTDRALATCSMATSTGRSPSSTPNGPPGSTSGSATRRTTRASG